MTKADHSLLLETDQPLHRRRHGPGGEDAGLAVAVVNRGELDRILTLELLAKGQVTDLAAGLKITEGLSERLLLEWLRELGHKITNEQWEMNDGHRGATGGCGRNATPVFHSTLFRRDKLTNVIGWSAGVFLMAELVFIFVVY